MDHTITTAWLRAATAVRTARERLADDAGEGVISAAITVLIMAFLGAAMWVAFEQLFTDTSSTVADQVGRIGGAGGGTGADPGSAP